jgi:alpha-D-xyloside xylohydrolase
LINPVTRQGATEREIVLPAARGWIDFWTGKRNPGGETIHADAPLDRVPIFVKQGSILPLGPVVQSAKEAADPLEIRVYSGRDADFELYEDDGDGYAYERGERATIPMHWDDLHQLLVIGPTQGNFPGMQRQHTVRIVKVRAGHGVGIHPEEEADRVVKYDGHRVEVRLAIFN